MRYVIIMLVMLTVSSCGIFKKTNKKLDKLESSHVVKRDCVTISDVVKKEIDKGSIDSEVVTVTEKKKPGARVKLSGKIDQGVNIITDSMGREFIAIFDTLSNIVEVSIDLPDEVEKTTKTERKQERKNKESNEVRKDQATVRDDKKIKVKESHLDKQSNPDYSWIWYVIAALVVVFVLFKKKII